MTDWILEKIYEIFYYIGRFICSILNMLYRLFGILSGTEQVSFNNTDEYLINLFFSNSTATTLYGGMALIGFILLFIFTILAVLRKMADLDDKVQTSLGSILRKTLTSFLFIISMNFIMFAAINMSNALMQSVTYLFDNSAELSQTSTITFDQEEYATMGRIFDVIGNYSLNSSSHSRYNLNSCFNEIREDMRELEKRRVFNYSYELEDGNGNTVRSWQSVLAEIARTHDLSEDQPLDEYNSGLSAALISAMDYISSSKGNMTVLESYTRTSGAVTNLTNTSVDVILWLSSTFDAAKNESYNGTDASLYDPVRLPYLTGARSIYDIDQVERDFSLDPSVFHHLLIIVGGCILVVEFLGIVINAVARLYNMLLLYIMAPPFIAIAPYDEGSRFKQWSTAFIIQCFGIFGSIIAMRLMLLLVPLIFSAELTLLPGWAGTFGKLILVLGAAYTAKRAGGMITGIISENAAMQSMYAGDATTALRDSFMGRMAGDIGGRVRGLLGQGAGKAAGMAFSAGKALVSSPIQAGKNFRRSDRRKALAGSMDRGDRAEVRDFLNMDKGLAMNKYGMNEKEYDRNRRRASAIMDDMNRGALPEEGNRTAPVQNRNTQNRNAQDGNAQNGNGNRVENANRPGPVTNNNAPRRNTMPDAGPASPGRNTNPNPGNNDANGNTIVNNNAHRRGGPPAQN